VRLPRPSSRFPFTPALFLLFQFVPLPTCVLTHKCQTLNDLVALPPRSPHSLLPCCLPPALPLWTHVPLLHLTLRRRPRELSAIPIRLHFRYEYTYGVRLRQLTLLSWWRPRFAPSCLSPVLIRPHFYPMVWRFRRFRSISKFLRTIISLPILRLHRWTWYQIIQRDQWLPAPRYLEFSHMIALNWRQKIAFLHLISWFGYLLLSSFESIICRSPSSSGLRNGIMRPISACGL